ncbi:hypothetical protein [Pseudonocardia sp. NPDC049635]|uniref:hypothetical protein n=1 Tax=Pseudonocardia sp. NPDC049635 TaxID=3155506 RepID=UPI0034042C93
MTTGVLFAGIQFVHPSEELASVSTGRWSVVGALTFAMAVAGLVGITGLYLVQVERSGVPGLVGYLLLAGFHLLTASYTFTEAVVLPPLVGIAPLFVTDVIGIPSGGEPVGDVGALGIFGPISGVLFTGGGVLFGFGLWRGRVVPRPAAILLVAGSLAPLLAALLPEECLRCAALPVALALVVLGGSLWRHRRTEVAVPGGARATVG